jgi:hypothetical protein
VLPYLKGRIEAYCRSYPLVTEPPRLSRPIGDYLANHPFGASKGLPAEQSGQMRTDAAQNGEGYNVTPIHAAAFAVNDKDAAWVDAMCVKHPLATFEQKLALSGRQVPKRV